MPITNKILNTALPTIVPNPTLDLETNVPNIEVKNSGALPPAALVTKTCQCSRLDCYFYYYKKKNQQ